MMKGIYRFLMILLLLVYNLVYGQNIEIFKDSNTSNWGLRDESSKSIIVPAKLPKITDFNDTIIVAKYNNWGRMAVFDYDGKNLLEKKNTLLILVDLKFKNCPYDTAFYGTLFEVPMRNPKEELNMRGFEINLQGQCIPNDYFPCPAWAESISFDYLPEYIRLLQKGEEYSWACNMDSAILMCKKAMEYQPDNPAVYFWGASIFVGEYYAPPKSAQKCYDAKYNDWIEMCLEKSLELENRGYYRYVLLRMKKYYYSFLKNNTNSVTLLNKELRALKKECK